MQYSLPMRVPLGSTVQIVLSVLLAIWGEWALFTQKLVLDGVVLFAVAALLFVRAVLPDEKLVCSAERQPGQSAIAEKTRRSRTAILAAPVIVLFSWVFSDGNRIRPETLVFWMAAIAVYLGLFWESQTDTHDALTTRLARVFSRPLVVPWSAVGLVAVVVVAAFFRYYQIASIPAEMTSDHAEKLLDVQDVLNGQYRVFFPRNTGREPLQFYLEVPFVWAFGLSHLSLKALTATVSLLSVPVVFFIGREMAGNKYGLLAAYFLAVSKWDVGIGRLGLRFPFYAFFAALTFLFLLRALRRGRRNDYLLCGLVMGIGAYGYTPFRITPILVAMAIGVRALLDLRTSRSDAISTLLKGVLCSGMALVTFIPLAHYLVDNPDSFWFRALTRVSGTEAALPPNPLSVFLSNLVNGLLMFNWRGDVVWITTISGDPALDFVSGGLFILGIAWCAKTLVKDREPVAGYMLMALLVFMMPSVTSIAFPIENPSFSRSGGNTSIVALIVAAPVYLVTRRLLVMWSWRSARIVVLAGMVVLLAFVGKLNYDRYFTDFPPQYRAAAPNSSEIGGVIRTFGEYLGSTDNVYLKDWPHWVDTRNVALNAGQLSWWTPQHVLGTPEDLARLTPKPGNFAILINKADQDAVRMVQQRYPQGILSEQKSAVAGRDFYVFFVAAR